MSGYTFHICFSIYLVQFIFQRGMFLFTLKIYFAAVVISRICMTSCYSIFFAWYLNILNKVKLMYSQKNGRKLECWFDDAWISCMLIFYIFFCCDTGNKVCFGGGRSTDASCHRVCFSNLHGCLLCIVK